MSYRRSIKICRRKPILVQIEQKKNRHFTRRPKYNSSRISTATHRLLFGAKDIFSTSFTEKKEAKFTLHTSFPSVLCFPSQVSKTNCHAQPSHKPFHF